MMEVYSVFAVFILLISFGYCHFTCSDPPATTDVFMDWMQLTNFYVRHSGRIQSPKTCSGPNDTTACGNQICCFEEVGCCYTDPRSGGQHCGCRNINDPGCTRPAPIVVVKNAVCEPHKKAAVSMCLRKKLQTGWSQPSVGWKSLLDPEQERSGSEGTTQADYGPADESGAVYMITSNGDAGSDDIEKKWSAELLFQKLKFEKLAKLYELMKKDARFGV